MTQLFPTGDRLNVQIENVLATPEQLQRLMGLISDRLGNRASSIAVVQSRVTGRGIYYSLRFSVADAESFQPGWIERWLWSTSLVGWTLHCSR